MGEALRHLGQTRQRLLRQMLPAIEGCTVETLCERLRISHNAVRQHLTALIGHGWVQRVASLPSGGRPQMRYGLTASGRELFPRNYGLLSTALLAQLHEQFGDDGLEAFLEQLGRNVAAAQPLLAGDADHEARVRALAQRLDELGYEAVPVHHDGEWQVEAFNCVFHALARQHPQVCRFDLAYMKAATGRRIHHMECIVRGGHVCRFRVGPEPASGDAG